MKYDFTWLKKRVEEAREWLSQEFSAIKTGRATPQIVERITIEAYGTKSPLTHVASVSVEGPKTLRVVPWDKSHISAIQNAIDKANLGISTAPDEHGVRVIFPEMTEETRRQTLKIVRERLEEVRISLRKARDEAWNEIQQKEREKEISEDEKFKYKEELQKIIDEAIRALDEAAKKKEADVLEK